jgi:hypothetical protein
VRQERIATERRAKPANRFTASSAQPVERIRGTSFIECGTAFASLALDIRRLDDGPPLFDFGFLLSSQHLGSLSFTRGNFFTQVG